MDDELPKRCGCTAGVNEALQKASCSRWKEHGSGKAALGRFAAAQDRCIFKVCAPAKWSATDSTDKHEASAPVRA